VSSHALRCPQHSHGLISARNRFGGALATGADVGASAPLLDVFVSVKFLVFAASSSSSVSVKVAQDNVAESRD
jgi:hypothetical protein